MSKPAMTQTRSRFAIPITGSTRSCERLKTDKENSFFKSGTLPPNPRDLSLRARIQETSGSFPLPLNPGPRPTLGLRLRSALSFAWFQQVYPAAWKGCLLAAHISRIWRAFGLQPHHTESFKLSPAPLLIEKVRDLVGLYMNPPEHALVICVDEKSQIQALDRTQPMLPLSPGQVERAHTTTNATALPPCSLHWS